MARATSRAEQECLEIVSSRSKLITWSSRAEQDLEMLGSTHARNYDFEISHELIRSEHNPPTDRLEPSRS